MTQYCVASVTNKQTNLRSLIHKNISLQLQTSSFIFVFSHIRGQQCDTWVWGLRMEWLVIVFCDLRQRNFNENQVFSHAGKSANAGMWQANGPKGNVLGLCQPLRRYVLVSEAAYTSVSGPPECIGTWGLVPCHFFGRLVNPNSIIICKLWLPHRLVPTKIFDIPAALLCTPYLICTYTKSKMNGVSCWL